MYRLLNIIFCIADVLIAMISLQMREYQAGALLLFLSSLLRFIFKLSNGSFFLELIYLHTTLTCLLMPVIGYTYFDQTNPLARLWVKYMPVTELTYFGFLIPATVSLGLAFFISRVKSKDDHTVINPLVAELKLSIQKIPSKSILILAFASLIAYFISRMLPAAFQQINTFLYFSFYTSIFYVYYYANFPYRKIFLLLAVVFILNDALRSSMFTIIAYMSGIFMILILAERKISVAKRILFICGGFAFLVFVQLFKLNWRQARVSGTQDVTEIVALTASKTSTNQVKSILFPIYLRMNQGYNIALVQRRIPQYVDYLGGDYLVLTFTSAFVPRLFWPDKPAAGGRYNMLMYTGKTIRGWSTNVGPLGEAYGNFGNIGGWFYMFGFGLFIRFAYTRYLQICKKRPILFIWMPVLFFQVVYVMETDSLQAFNSLIKGAIFIFVMYKLFPSLFPKSTS